jgi:hypothetical protein
VKRLENKKIAILGTSPIMILLYFRLKKKNLVDVFEHSKIGGAWRIDKYKEKYYSAHNNVVVALNDNEEKYIELINKELARFGCKKTKPKGMYQLLSDYIPKKKYIHDLSNFYLNFKENCNSLKKKKITSVNACSDKVYLNNLKYDQVFFPSCFDVNKISINNLNFNVKPTKSISSHLTIVYKKTKLPSISYTENFDNVFDRAHFRENSRYIFFTGRIRRNYKKLQSSQLIKISNLLQNTTKNIIKIKKNRYCHNIIKEDNLRDLKLRLNQTKLSIVETKQFVKSYKLLNKLK